MSERIGKYQIEELIGRGGMGTIFKAHDPVLDRPVALKVISSELEVTDELRARFFREAQACARMSHPNIVTVYDMGEDNGRLFFVMELLNGEELRRFIAQRRVLALEDKLAIMVQVCDGLHYAHQKGVVHRDIKPGNIFLLHNGQVKILDFGIAQIADTEAGLTRTGLIMGTLRYVAPEQVRGRADYRSDIYSVGAVFYEFLSLRPPFLGDDPMHLLEQLRTEVPPPLNELDSGIPVELAVIVDRAMRKDPQERFADLEQMRTELERVQQGLVQEAQRIRGRVRGQCDRVRDLQVALGERIGPLKELEAVPVIDDRGRLATMQALERDLGVRIEALQAKVARAEAVAEAMRRGAELLEARQFAEAMEEFEGVVAEMPEHARASEALGQARARAEEDRRHQLAVKLVQEARATLAEEAYTLCLEILKQAIEIPPPAEMAEEIAQLRLAAESGLAAQEAARRARQVERARDQMIQARLAARAQAAPRYVPALWNDAEVKAAEAQAALERGTYAEAVRAFEAAGTAFGDAEKLARTVQQQERGVAERARQQAAEGQERARVAEAPESARELWEAAEAKSAEANAAFVDQSFSGAVAVFDEAIALYRRAEEAGQARQRERRRATEAREQAEQARRSAAEADAQQYAGLLWDEASARWAEGQMALQGGQYAAAAAAIEGAVGLYREAENHARDARRRQQERAEQGHQAIAECRRGALNADAPLHAPADWGEAEAGLASGESALASGAFAQASDAFERGMALYRRAEERAREVARAREVVRVEAEKGREVAAQARRGAVEAQASLYASEHWRAGESAEAQADEASGRQDYAAARSLFAAARRRYIQAMQTASVAVEAETRRADALVGDARRLLGVGDIEACLRRLGEALALRPGHAEAAQLRLEAEAGLRGAETAASTGETADRGDGRDALAETMRREERAAVPVKPTGAVSKEGSGAPIGLGAPTVDEPTVLAAPSGAEASAVPAGASATTDGATSQAAPSRMASHPRDSIAEDATVFSPRGPRRDRTPAASPAIYRFLARRRSLGVALGALGTFVVIALAITYQPPSPPPIAPLRAQVVAARGEAIRAGAERLASFTRASEKERAAEVAIGQHEGARQQQLYREALTGYREAKTDADRARGAVQTAQSRAAEARKAAEIGEAARRAPLLWAKGETAQREAERAFEQNAFDRAEALFGEAARIYREAQVPDLPKQDPAEAERVRALVASARREAERADARRLAPQSFASARQKEDEADGVLDRDPAGAKATYQEALRLYKEAVREADTQRVALKRAEAGQAQERMTSARRDAEQSAGSQRAPVLFAWAERKQREAGAAFRRSEYVLAEWLFSDSQADYEIAAQEARRAGDVTASGRSSVEQARRRAVTYREHAIKAEANRLAADLFTIARAKEVGADELVSQESFLLATQAYGEAGDRYLAAARRAGEHLEADRARSEMRAEKQRANRKVPEYKDGLTEEDLGTSAYEQLEYKQATERFRTAKAFYGRAATRTAGGPPSSTPSRR